MTLTTRRHVGFSLIELIIVLGILSLMVVVVGSFTTDVFRVSRIINVTLSRNEQTRRTLGSFVNELRTAAISSLGTYPIAAATSTNLTFYSNLDQDALKERLRYFVQGTTLKRGVLKPSGNPLAYNPANETITDSVQNLLNPTDIFSYFDNTYNGQTAPLAFPVTITSLRLVRIHVRVDTTPNESPSPFDLTSEVMLRNLKDNL